MKQLFLLVLIGFVFLAYGFSKIDSYTLEVVGPPTGELPKLEYGDPGHPSQAELELKTPPIPGRNLLYRFNLESGTYPFLHWTGNGVDLPPAISIHNFWNEPVTTLTVPLTYGSFDLASPDHRLVLPAPGVLSLAWWLIENAGLWILAVLGFLLLQNAPPSALKNCGSRVYVWCTSRASNRKLLLLTFIVLAPVWLVLCLPGVARFDVGDDPAMELLASGRITGHPSEYLVFINVIVGLVLKGCYLVAPFIPWYPCLLFSAVLFSLVGITFLLLRDDRADRIWWLASFAIVFGIYLLTHLQFTSAGYLPGLLGMLIFAQGKSRRSLLAGAVLVVIGSLFRFDAFLLLVLTVSAGAWVLSRRPVLDKALFFVAILSVSYAGHWADHQYYDRQDDWGSYREYNRLRGDLHMNPKLSFSEKNRPVFAQASWSRNDFDLFREHWLFEDPAAYSQSKLSYLSQHLSPDRDGTAILMLLLTIIALVPTPILMFLSIFLHELDNSRRSLPVIIAILGPILLILGALVLTVRIPPRVVVPVLYAASLFLLVASSEQGETLERIKSKILLPLVFITITILSLYNAWNSAVQNRETAQRLLSSLDDLTPYQDKVLVASINSFPLERLNPWTALADTQKVRLMQLMWSGGSPSFQSQLQHNGSASLFQSLASDPHFWLMVPAAQRDRGDSFSLYMLEHYHLKITMTPVILADGKPAVFPDFTVLKAVPAVSP